MNIESAKVFNGVNFFLSIRDLALVKFFYI